MTPFAARRLPATPDALAPDGSDVRVLLALPGGSMAHFQLAPGRASAAVDHRTVDEIWYVLTGRGEMWRRQDGREETVPLEPDDYLDAHPTTAILVVEVADTTLDDDRDVKASIYAAAGIPDYWVLNLVDGRLEIFRDPVDMPGTPTGRGYRPRPILQPSDTISPVARLDVTIPLDRLIRRSRV